LNANSDYTLRDSNLDYSDTVMHDAASYIHLLVESWKGMLHYYRHADMDWMETPWNSVVVASWPDDDSPWAASCHSEASCHYSACSYPEQGNGDEKACFPWQMMDSPPRHSFPWYDVVDIVVAKMMVDEALPNDS